VTSKQLAIVPYSTAGNHRYLICDATTRATTVHTGDAEYAQPESAGPENTGPDVHLQQLFPVDTLQTGFYERCAA